MACYHARLGQSEAALYWLQRSAIEESADADYAALDSDLATLRTDPRWPGVFAFLKATQAWYRTHPLDRQLLSLPAHHQLGGSLPLVIGLHGLGSDPEDFAGAWDGLADELGVAFLSVSGTETLGPQAYRWTEDVEADTARLERAIAAVAPHVKAIDGQVFLIGFSQGAQMAVEIVAHRPSRFGGAIAMSPGLRGSLVPLASPAADASMPRSVLVANEKEHPGTIRFLRQNEDQLKALGAQVHTHLYAGVATHSFSPDFRDALPRWLRFLARGGPVDP